MLLSPSPWRSAFSRPWTFVRRSQPARRSPTSSADYSAPRQAALCLPGLRCVQRFEQLLAMAERTGRAWKLKELARSLWRGGPRGQVEADWNRRVGSARQGGLPVMAQAAETIRRHLWGVLDAILCGVSNARSEGINALIQRAKRNACGCRNWERFRASVLFLCGGLDLSPESAFPHETRQTRFIMNLP